MMNPKELSIDDFNYTLPTEKIALFPPETRDSSRLLIYKNQQIVPSTFTDITDFLPQNALIVFNDTRVVEARIIFHKPTGAKIEVFCLEPDDRYPDVATALATSATVFWKCLVGNASSWSDGLELVNHIHEGLTIGAKLISRHSDHFIVQLSWSPENISFAEILHHAGLIPLPPYIKRQADADDAKRYQTIYAHYAGSVAAPTAGLHFTERVLNQLEEKNIKKDFVTLHVGAGTFKPVKAAALADHEMHAEFIELNRSLIDNLLLHQHTDIIAVGTTSLRTLESIYWIGARLHKDPQTGPRDLYISQWEPYEEETSISAKEALTAIIRWMEKNNLETLVAKTALLIAPGYRFRIVTVLITNFHQPKSTLLLLVSAFIGDAWKSVYAYALKNNFRFLSYGDSCLFFRQ